MGQTNLHGRQVFKLESEARTNAVEERQGTKYKSDFGRFFRGIFFEIGADKFKELIDQGAGESENNLARLLKSELKTSTQKGYWERMFEINENKTFVGRDGQTRQSRFKGGALGHAIYKNYFDGKSPTALEIDKEGHHRVKEGKEFPTLNKTYKSGEIVPKKELNGFNS